MGVALSTTLHTSFDDAVLLTRDALAEHRFGVLTEIDVKATLKAKLNEDMEDCLILGACNPPLAQRAVNIDRQIGLLFAMQRRRPLRSECKWLRSRRSDGSPSAGRRHRRARPPRSGRRGHDETAGRNRFTRGASLGVNDEVRVAVPRCTC